MSLPRDIEAERAIIGTLLLKPAALKVLRLESLTVEDFSDEHLRAVFAAMSSLASQRASTDVHAVGRELRRSAEPDASLANEHLPALLEQAVDEPRLSECVSRVRNAATRRRLIECANSIIRDATERGRELHDLLISAEERIGAVARARQPVPLRPIKSSVTSVFSLIERRYKQQLEVTGVSTGFRELDRLTTGFHRGSVIVIAGGPSTGKTSLLLSITRHVATECKLPTAFFSSDASVDWLTTRLLASGARVELHALASGRLLDSDWARVAHEADRLFRAPLFIEETASALPVADVLRACRETKAKHGDLGLVVLDCIDIIDGCESASVDVMRRLKALAKELDAPVLAVVPSNAPPQNADARLLLSELRASALGTVDADVVCFLQRGSSETRLAAEAELTELVVARQRNGPTGIVRLRFLPKFTQFEEGDAPTAAGAACS